jgi:hypothetical protein
MAELLEDGDPFEPEHAVLRVAVALANLGRSYDELMAELLDPRNGISEGVRSRSAHRGRRTPRGDRGAWVAADRATRKALRFVAQRPPASDGVTLRAEVSAIRAIADDRPDLWGGQGGSGRRLTLDALLDLAEQACTLLPTASTRQLAEMTGLHRKTVGSALRWLCSRSPFVVMEEPFDGPKAGRWRLRRPAEGTRQGAPVGVSPIPGRASGAPCRPARVARHDAFSAPGREGRTGGLGKTAARILAELQAASETGEALTAAELAARTGLHRRTVRRHLPVLQAVGLIQHGIGDTWTPDPSGDLDGIARLLGVSGRGADRQEYHRRERIAYHLRLAEHDAARGWARQRGRHRAPTIVDKADGSVWLLSGAGSAWDQGRQPNLAPQQVLLGLPA